MVWAQVGLAVASSVLSSSQSDKSWKDAARKSGKNLAQVEASRARAAALLPQKSKQIADQALAASVEGQMTEAAQVSEATVQAAAAGAAGANVQQGIQSIQGNAERVQSAIEKQRRAGLLQINQDYEDLFWEAEGQKSGVQARGGSSTGRNIASAALAGVGAYYGNR